MRLSRKDHHQDFSLSKIESFQASMNERSTLVNDATEPCNSYVKSGKDVSDVGSRASYCTFGIPIVEDARVSCGYSRTQRELSDNGSVTMVVCEAEIGTDGEMRAYYENEMLYAW